MNMDHPTESICPACRNALTAVGEARPWCPSCELGLGDYVPEEARKSTGWRWLDPRAHRLAFRLTKTQYEVLRNRPVNANPTSLAAVTTSVVAALLLAGVAALLGLGCWMVLDDFPSPMLLPGVIAVLVAVALRPRLPRLPDSVEPVTREQAPALFSLIDRVATATGTRSPDQVVVDSSFNAFAATVGLRRRRVLCLGLPLWCVLPAAQRVALLGHELGHFHNGDIRRGVMTQPMFTTIARLADLLRPGRRRHPANSWIILLAELVAGIVLALVYRILLLVHIALLAIGFREYQQAEYLADDMAARAAGTNAAADLCDTLLLIDNIALVIRSSARALSMTRRRGDSEQAPIAAQWQDRANQVVAELTPTLPARRQLSLRQEASLFAAHPPTGMRSRLLMARQPHDAMVHLDEATSSQIDLELDQWYQRLRRDLAANAA